MAVMSSSVVPRRGTQGSGGRFQRPPFSMAGLGRTGRLRSCAGTQDDNVRMGQVVEPALATAQEGHDVSCPYCRLPERLLRPWHLENEAAGALSGLDCGQLAVPLIDHGALNLQ